MVEGVVQGGADAVLGLITVWRAYCGGLSGLRLLLLLLRLLLWRFGELTLDSGCGLILIILWFRLFLWFLLRFLRSFILCECGRLLFRFRLFLLLLWRFRFGLLFVDSVGVGDCGGVFGRWW